MIGVTTGRCDRSHLGRGTDRAGQELV